VIVMEDYGDAVGRGVGVGFDVPVAEVNSTGERGCRVLVTGGRTATVGETERRRVQEAHRVSMRFGTARQPTPGKRTTKVG
jgi:hypothetical protein